MTEALISEARKIFHRRLIETGTLTLSESGVASNADVSSASSKALASRTAELVSRGCGCEIHTADKIPGQALGRQFEILVSEFLRDTFLKLDGFRPGKWIISRGAKTSDFSQYEHLAALSGLIGGNIQLAAMLGNDYIVAPDIVIYCERYDDGEINSHSQIVDGNSAIASDIRKTSGASPILHASISAKFTIRSDRAQNSRTEALNLIRNRKGHLLHIAARLDTITEYGRC